MFCHFGLLLNAELNYIMDRADLIRGGNVYSKRPWLALTQLMNKYWWVIKNDVSTIRVIQEIHVQYNHQLGKAERSNTQKERGRL